MTSVKPIHKVHSSIANETESYVTATTVSAASETTGALTCCRECDTATTVPINSAGTYAKKQIFAQVSSTCCTGHEKPEHVQSFP